MTDEYESFRIHLRYCILERNHRKERFVIAVQDTTDDAMLISEEVDPGNCRMDVIEHYILFLHALTRKQADRILDCMNENRTASARSELRCYFDNHTFTADGISDSPVIQDDLIPDEWYDSWKEMESCITCVTPQGYGETDIMVNCF